MNSFAKATLCAAIVLLPSCQTEPRPSRTIISATASAVWKEALCATGKAILVSHDDILTLETAEAIGDHNNALFCACAEKRPPTFDDAICKV